MTLAWFSTAKVAPPVASLQTPLNEEPCPEGGGVEGKAHVTLSVVEGREGAAALDGAVSVDGAV